MYPPPQYQAVPKNDSNVVDDVHFTTIPENSKSFKKIVVEYSKQFIKIIGKIVTFSYKCICSPLSILILIMIANVVAIIYIDQILYNDDLQNWMNHHERCQCKFDNNVNEIIYCEYLTATRPIPDDIDDTYHVVGENRPCYVSYTVKKINSVQYYFPEYEFLAFNGEANRLGLALWIVLSIGIFIFSLSEIIDSHSHRSNDL